MTNKFEFYRDDEGHVVIEVRIPVSDGGELVYRAKTTLEEFISKSESIVGASP